MADHGDQELNQETQNLCMGHTPTLPERIWRFLGFHSRIPEMTPAGEALPGWIMSKLIVRPSLGDRVRFLFAGGALIRMETRTDVEDINKVISAGSFELFPPGEDPYV